MGSDRFTPGDRLRIDAPRVEADPAFVATLAAWASVSPDGGPVRRPARTRLAVAAAAIAVAATTLTAAYAVGELGTPTAPTAPPATHHSGPEPAPVPPATDPPHPGLVEHGTSERPKPPHRVTAPPVAAPPNATATPLSASPENHNTSDDHRPTAGTQGRPGPPAPRPEDASPTIEPDEQATAHAPDDSDDRTGDGTGEVSETTTDASGT